LKLLLLPLLFLFLSADPPQASTLLRQGLQALQQGRVQDARNDLESGSKADPNNAYIWIALADVYLRLNEKQLASSAAEAAAKLGGSDPVVCHALAIYYGKAGDETAALPFAEKAAKADPNFAFEWAQRLLRLQEFTPAAALLESALQTNHHNVQLTLALGVARYGQRRFDEAIAIFLKVIQIDPAVDQPYDFLGRMLDQAGPRLADIVSADEAWAAQNPENGKAQLEVAKSLLLLHSDDPRPESLLRRSIVLDPSSWQAHYQLGALLADRHQFEEAAKELNQAIQLAPKQPTPHYRLARVYDRLGQPDKAAAERKLHATLTESPAQ
jgi:tetratricopeptide (TPR) repeat protein